MNDVASSDYPAEIDAEVEQLLRDYAASDIFGSPPPNLVDRTVASLSLHGPGRDRSRPSVSQFPGALVVLSLAAAGLILTAFSRPANWNRIHEVSVVSPPHAESRFSSNPAVLSPAISSEIDLTAPSQASTSATVIPQSGRSSSVRLIASTSIRHIHPRVFSRSAPKAIWSETIVSNSEQGIAVPVVTCASNSECGQQEHTGVAVMPITSTTTYTEYAGDNSR